MSESVATVTETIPIEADSLAIDDAAKAERKRARHRKKQLFERILKQMEFYFSDANLTKDRFLGELTRRDPAVPLEVFLKFNKIRSLIDNISDIAKAIQGSELIECVDETKVRRKVPLEEYDAESRTVYVESIPAMVGLDWLETIFSEYGRIAYISLPKFKNTSKNKGFAFIEFQTPEEAQKCLAAFTKMGCKLPTSMSPEELTTIKTFSAEHSSEDPSHKCCKADKNTKKGDESKNNESSIQSESEGEKQKVEPSKKNKNKKDNRSKKRKNEDTKEIAPAIKKAKTDSESEKEQSKYPESKIESGTDTENKEIEIKNSKSNVKKHDKKRTKEKRKSGEQPEKKKSKKDTVLNVNENIRNISTQKDETEKETKVEKIEKDENTEASSQEEGKVEGENKKKSRKRTAKERNKAKTKKSKCGLPEGAVLGLQVLSKTEWRTLRNKYLNLQRKQMKELKNTLRMQGVYHAPHNVEKKARTEEEKQACEAGEVSKLLKVEGVFVKVQLPEPCTDVRATKKKVRSNVHVQHVDVKESQNDMVIRFDTPESAQQYCSSEIYESSRVLLGAESEAEWARAEAERRSAGAGTRRPRGRDRLIRRAAAVGGNSPTAASAPASSHVRFDE